jgi:hypothetical protein
LPPSRRKKRPIYDSKFSPSFDLHCLSPGTRQAGHQVFYWSKGFDPSALRVKARASKTRYIMRIMPLPQLRGKRIYRILSPTRTWGIG